MKVCWLTVKTSYAKLRKHLRFFYYGKGREGHTGMFGMSFKKLHDEPEKEQPEATGAQQVLPEMRQKNAS